jgi:hypothetical protein
MKRLLWLLALAGCAYPTWTARVSGDVGATFTGSYTILQRTGGLASMSVSGSIPRTADGTSGWAEWSVSDGGRIVGATFVSTSGGVLRGEIRKNATVLTSGTASGRFGTLLLSPP